MRSYYELTFTTQAHLFPLGVKHVVPLSPILELLHSLVIEEWVLREKVNQVLLMRVSTCALFLAGAPPSLSGSASS